MRLSEKIEYVFIAAKNGIVYDNGYEFGEEPTLEEVVNGFAGMGFVMETYAQSFNTKEHWLMQVVVMYKVVNEFDYAAQNL